MRFFVFIFAIINITLNYFTMTITLIDGTHVRLDGKSVLKSAITVNLVGGAYLQIIKNADNSDLLPLTKWDGIRNGGTGEYYVSQAEFQADMTAVFGIVAPAGVSLATTGAAGLVKKAAAPTSAATSPGATYVQAEAVAVFSELRDLETKLRAAGVIA